MKYDSSNTFSPPLRLRTTWIGQLTPMSGISHLLTSGRGNLRGDPRDLHVLLRQVGLELR